MHTHAHTHTRACFGVPRLLAAVQVVVCRTRRDNHSLVRALCQLVTAQPKRGARPGWRGHVGTAQRCPCPAWGTHGARRCRDVGQSRATRGPQNGELSARPGREKPDQWRGLHCRSRRAGPPGGPHAGAGEGRPRQSHGEAFAPARVASLAADGSCHSRSRTRLSSACVKGLGPKARTVV